MAMPTVLRPATDASYSDCVRVNAAQEHGPLNSAGSAALTSLKAALEKTTWTKAVPKLALPQLHISKSVTDLSPSWGN